MPDAEGADRGPEQRAPPHPHHPLHLRGAGVEELLLVKRKWMDIGCVNVVFYKLLLRVLSILVLVLSILYTLKVKFGLLTV